MESSGDLHQEMRNLGIIAESRAMCVVFELARHAAHQFRNILLVGPVGVGKKRLAQMIHRMSPVSAKPFAVCNCAALSEIWLESQLFGHVAGAFSGAIDTRPGVFEAADGGMVFLDNIDEGPAAVQAGLLRVVQCKKTQRIGSAENQSIDVRLIAATNRDPREEVRDGKLREDLYYHLSSIEIRILPLSKRRADIPALAESFTMRFSTEYGKRIVGLTERAKTALFQYPWPGNVREMESVIAAACITASTNVIDVGDLPVHVRNHSWRVERVEADQLNSLEDVRNAHIQQVLSFCHGNRNRAARILGIGRTSLYRHLRSLRRNLDHTPGVKVPSGEWPDLPSRA